jgi:hypothetical protein
MEKKKSLPRKVIIIRWIARLWSLGIFVFALIRVFSPDPHATGEPLAFREIFMLSMWGLSIVGLMVAWIRELPGALIAIIGLFLRELLYLVLYKEWIVNFLLIWVVIIPPAILYLLAWKGSKKIIS